MRAYLRHEKQKLNQESRGGKRFWYVLFVGCFAALYGGYFLLSSPGDQLETFFTLIQVGGGTGMALTGAAELLPKDKFRLTALLRKLALAIMALSLVGAAMVYLL